MIARRSLLLAGAAFPASVPAYGQCVTNTPAVDACRGGVRVTGPVLPPGVSLDLSFMTPGTLDPRITFTRASTATYTDSTGTIQTAAVNAPRWDYDPVTHALRGVLIEEARTNLALQSGNIANAAWLVASSAVGAPTVTGNQTTAPDGTATAARVDLPAVSGASAFIIVYQNVTLPAGIATVSFYLRGNVGGERVYITLAGWGSAPAILTTQWQRFVFIHGIIAHRDIWRWYGSGFARCRAIRHTRANHLRMGRSG